MKKNLPLPTDQGRKKVVEQFFGLFFINRLNLIELSISSQPTSSPLASRISKNSENQQAKKYMPDILWQAARRFVNRCRRAPFPTLAHFVSGYHTLLRRNEKK
ncbi:hypothetical protein L0128_08515 [candidate division KSB1 bacterium]|nr:hypothetical protein [candidate division KSB1 bacterium]